MANFASANVSVLLGNGDGTFQAHRTFAAGALPRFVAVGDVNGDGRPDLAVANQEIANVSVLLGNGDGTFQAARNFAAGFRPLAVQVGEYNGDGRADLAVAGYGGGVRVLLGDGNGSFRTTSYVAGFLSVSLAVADFSADGWPDLAVANYGSDDVSVLLNDANWPGGPVAHFYVYPDTAAVTAGTPVDLAVFALNASFSLVPEYTGEVLFVITDTQATTPGPYTFRPENRGIAFFAGGVTFRTPGQHFLLVIDTATFSVFGFAAFDVQAPFAGGGAAGPALDLFLTEALADAATSGLPPTYRSRVR